MSQPIRVLIAEDRSSDAELLVRELRRAGFEPEWRRVDSEADYLQALAPDWDVILCDYSMPQFDAPRALLLLQERGYDVPFIIVSGTVGEDAAVAAMKDGANDYLIKDRLTRLGTAVRHAIEERQQREQSRRVQAQLRRFMSSSPVVLYALAVRNGELELSWISDNVTRLTGHSLDDALEKSWWTGNIHPDDRERVLAAHPRPYALDQLLLEYRFLRKDGSWFWVRDEKRLSRSSDGVTVEVIGSWADVTERKQADDAVREGEARLAGVVNSAMDAIITVDAAQRIVLFNASAERMFRCSGDAALGQPLETFVPARYRAGHAEHVRQFGTTGVTSRSMGALGAISGLRADGEEFPIEASISQTEVAGNKLYTVILRDITERRRAERWQALQLAVTQVLADATSLHAAAPGIIQAVCETLGGKFGAVWEIDPRVNNLRCADIWHVPGLVASDLETQTRQISFAPGSGLPGRVWASGKPLVVADVARDPEFQRAAAAARAGLRGAVGFPILLRGEVVGVVDFLGAEIHAPEPELLVMLAAIGSQIGQFIEHQRAAQQLLQAQRMEAVGQLAGGIAHDFNNLLGVILGYCEVAARELGEDHSLHRRIEPIHKAAERAAALTRQILTFSRKQAIDVRICDLNHIVEETQTMLGRLIGEDVRLTAVLARNLGAVRADPGQLEQVIMNLAVNARDAMPSGGQLIVETSNVDLDERYCRGHPEVRPGRYVMLAVSDTGMGMEPATLTRIFEPFFTTKELGKGTGLGLAVVYGIVKQSGGSVAVESELGRGSTFNVYFPRTDAQASQQQTTALAAAVGGSEVVLLVEDEQALREIVSETLKMAGYAVLEASEADEALAVAARSPRPIQLVITDIVLPGLSGPEMVSRMRNTQPGVRVLLVSGYAEGPRGRTVSIEPGTPFLGKPFTIDALLRKVRAVLDGQEPSPEQDS
jgi:two-component system, cell cycle sensor histidine kinase and response regulator CckA